MIHLHIWLWKLWTCNASRVLTFRSNEVGDARGPVSFPATGTVVASRVPVGRQNAWGSQRGMDLPVPVDVRRFALGFVPVSHRTHSPRRPMRESPDLGREDQTAGSMSM